MTIDDRKIPQPLVEMARQVRRFVEGVQRLEFPDDRRTAVAAAATRFTNLIDGVIEAAVAPSLDDELVKTNVMSVQAESAVSRLDQLVTIFREDAAAGNTKLPDMNDLAIGLRMFSMETEELENALELLSVEKTLKPSTERTALLKCLTEIGVPIASVGIQPPVLIKTLISTILTLMARADPNLQQLVIMAMDALSAIDELAQDSMATAGVGLVIGRQGPVEGVGPELSEHESCGKPFTIPVRGDGNTLDDATRNAEAKAIRSTAGRCRPGCVPIKGRTRIISVSVFAEIDFDCVSAAG